MKQLVLLYPVFTYYYHELSDVPFVNGFYIADSAFPNLRPDDVSNDSSSCLISFHHV